MSRDKVTWSSSQSTREKLLRISEMTTHQKQVQFWEISMFVFDYERTLGQRSSGHLFCFVVFAVFAVEDW